MSGELVKLLSDLKEPEALSFVEKAMGEGVDPMEILGEAQEGMKIVGNRFAREEYFLPELVVSGDAPQRLCADVGSLHEGRPGPGSRAGRALPSGAAPLASGHPGGQHR